MMSARLPAFYNWLHKKKTAMTDGLYNKRMSQPNRCGILIQITPSLLIFQRNVTSEKSANCELLIESHIMKYTTEPTLLCTREKSTFYFANGQRFRRKVNNVRENLQKKENVCLSFFFSRIAWWFGLFFLTLQRVLRDTTVCLLKSLIRTSTSKRE